MWHEEAPAEPPATVRTGLMIKLADMPRRLFERVFPPPLTPLPMAEGRWKKGPTVYLDDYAEPDNATATVSRSLDTEPPPPTPASLERAAREPVAMEAPRLDVAARQPAPAALAEGALAEPLPSPSGVEAPGAEPEATEEPDPIALQTALETARSLTDQGHFEFAERTLDLARQRFPNSPEPLVDHARIAEIKGDWAAVATRYTVLRIRFPNELRAWRGAARALRELGRLDEADTLLQTAKHRFPAEASLFIESGRVAEARKHWHAMAERFATVLERFPREGSGYSGGAEALAQLGKFEEAEALLQAGQQRLPTEAILFVEHARIAERRRDWAVLETRCAALRERFPDEPWPYVGGAKALRGLGRYGEVDALLTEADLRFPMDAALWVEYARAADDRGDWAEALARGKVIREKFPDNWWGYVGSANALDMLGRREEARLLLEAALARIPADADPLGAYCWLAQNRRDWPEAIARWDAYRRHFPERAVSYVAESIALRELSRFDEAESLVLEGLRRYPDDSELLANHAFVASSRADWRTAVARWRTYANRFPDQALGYIQTGLALRELARYPEADAILREALKRFPDDREIIAGLARNSNHRRDWLEALRRWKTYCERFPDDRLGPEQAKLVLQELGYYDETRNANPLEYQTVIGRLRSELYGGDSPLAYANPRNADDGYPHTNLRPDLIESVLDIIRPRFWLELGSGLGGSAIRTASVIKAQVAATEIVCIDSFTGGVDMWASEQSKKQAGGWQFLRLERGRPTIYDRFLANVAAAGHDDIVLPIQATSTVGLRLLQRLADEQRLNALPNVIFLDGGHEPDATLHELRNCWDLLQPGGVLIGDDWDEDAVQTDVLRFVQTVEINTDSASRLMERHRRFTRRQDVLLDRGQWVLTK